MDKSHFSARARLFVGVSAIMLATSAIAQEASDVNTSDDIIVTAQKRAQRVEDIGITMDVFSGDAIRSQGIKTAQDLGLVTPGLVVNDAGAQGSPIYTLRGVGFTNVYANASSTVGLYTDDVAIPYPVMSRGALFDIERIEVLKGPQGDLYGRNTTAGQINFITGKPTDTFSAGGTLEYGRFAMADAEGFVSGPIAEGVQVRLAGKRVLSAGWQRSLTRPDDKYLGALDQAALRGKVNIDFSPDVALLLSGYWIRDTSDGGAVAAYDGRDIGLPTAQTASPGRGTIIFSRGDNRAADWSTEFRPKRNSRTRGVSGQFSADLGQVSIASITAYDKFYRADVSDNDGSPARIAGNINYTSISTFSQELRLSSDGAKDFTWIVGAYYSKDKISEDYNYFMEDSYFRTALGIFQLNTRYRQRTESGAGFAHAEWQITPVIQLVGGVRYTHEKRSFTGCTYDRDGTYSETTNRLIRPVLLARAGLPDPGPVAPGACNVYDDRRDSPNFGTFTPVDDAITAKKWMGKFGVNFKPNRDVLVYATASSGFKSGGFSGGNSNTATQQSSYKPERLNSIELGTKIQLRELGLNFDAAAFYYDYRNKQENGLAVTFVGNINGLTNIPKSRIFGAEIGGRWQMTDHLSLGFGGTYLNTKILEWTRISPLSRYPAVLTYDASGLPLPNTPKWSFIATPAYKVDVGSDMSLELATDISYRSSTSGSGLVYRDVKGYTVVNARITLAKADGPWELSLWGKNIFNEYYWQYANDVGGSGPYYRVPGMPVTYGVRLGVRF